MKKLPLSFYVQMMVCAILWGSAFPVIKLSYETLALDGYGEKLIFAGVRFTVAGLLVMVFCRRSVVRSLVESPKLGLLWVVLGQTFFQYVFFYYGLSVSSGALGALLVGTGSVWWVILAPILLKTPFPSSKQWLILAVCGVGVTIAVYAPGAGSGNVAAGTIAFLLATLSGAIGAIGLKRIAPKFGSRTITSLSLGIGGVMLIAAGAYEWTAFWSDFGWRIAGVTLYLAIVSATAFTLWNSLIERYSVNVLSAFRFLIPLCGVIESVAFVESETLGIGILLGGAVVIGSLVAMGRSNQQS